MLTYAAVCCRMQASERELREAALTKLQTSPRKMGYEMDGGGLDGARAEIAALLGQVHTYSLYADTYIVV